VALSMQLHSGPEFFLSLQVDDLNDYAQMVKTMWDEVAKRRGKK
jgi:hypothetical protein